jgi:dTDP-4-amino-4,6-dideoxygalactose transaminase
MNNIPFVDLRAQHEEVRSEIEQAIREIIDRSSFIGGSYVNTFEKQFADYLGVKEVVGVANGTDALWLSMSALGIGPGDAVITVPNTFIATVEAITRTGACPLFVDIDLDTSTISSVLLNEFLEKDCRVDDSGEVYHVSSGLKIVAILPVHLYGLPADMQPILQLARKYNLLVIEDACQAHGARYRINGTWQRVGGLGKTGAFSFYPAKNLGAMGDGGAISTNDQELAQKLRMLRDHSSKDKYIHPTSSGWNSRLDALQAAILTIKLQKLDEWNIKRRETARYYQQVLRDLPLELPVEPKYAEPVYHLFVVRSANRDQLRVKLSEYGIGVGLHYPIPLHLQEAYTSLGYTRGNFPNSEQSAATVLSLPMHPAMTSEQVEEVGKACAEILLPLRS